MLITYKSNYTSRMVLTNNLETKYLAHGVQSYVISVPCRYIQCLLKLEDIYNTVRLIDVFIKNPANIILQ